MPITTNTKPRPDLIEKYGAVLAEARDAFLTDSSYAVQIAEAGAAYVRRAEGPADPEETRADILRLHAEGARLSEIQRVMRTSRESILEVLKDAPPRAQDAPRVPIDHARNYRPPNPVVTTWTTPRKPQAIRVQEEESLPGSRGERRCPDDHVHGRNLTCYASHGCRCDDCRRANTEAHRRKAERRLARERGEKVPRSMSADKRCPPEHRHAVGCYTNHHCRCEQCTEAKRANNAAYRASKRA